MTTLDTFSILFTSNAGTLRKELSDTEKAYENLKNKINQTADEKKKMLELEASVKSLRGELEKYDLAKGRLGSSLLMLGAEAVAGYATFEGIKNGIANAIDYNAELQKVSVTTGLNVRQLAVYDAAFQQTGSSAGEFTNWLAAASVEIQKNGGDVNQAIPKLKLLSDQIKVLRDQGREAEAHQLFQNVGAQYGGLPQDFYNRLRDGSATFDEAIQKEAEFNSETQETADAARKVTGELKNVGNELISVFTPLIPIFDFITNGIGLMLKGLRLISDVIATIWDLKISPDLINQINQDFPGLISKQGGAAQELAPQTRTSVQGGATRVPLGIRSNNPGNLQPGGIESVFPTLDAGIAAEQAQLQKYGQRGINTLRGIARTWSRGASGYLEGLVKATGFSADQQLDLTDKAILAKVSNAINQQENGAAYGNLIGAAQSSLNTADHSPFNASQSVTGSSLGNSPITIGNVTINGVQGSPQDFARAFKESLNEQLAYVNANRNDGIKA